MRRAFLMIGLAMVPAATVILPSVVSADVLTFDDIGFDDIGWRWIPDGYGGFNWNQFAYIKQGTHPDSGYDHGVVSGEYAAFNYNAAVATVDGSVFTFTSAYFTAAWSDGLNIRIDAYAGSAHEHTRTIVVNTTGPTLFTFDWTGIDRLAFTSFGGVDADLGGSGEHFVMDNFTLTRVSAVPLPAAAWAGMSLLGVMLGAKSVRRRWRRS